MAIAVGCVCGQKYQVGDTLAGKRVRCKKCGATFEVPEVVKPLEDDGIARGGGAVGGGLADLLGESLPGGVTLSAPLSAPKSALKTKKKAKRQSKSQTNLLIAGLALLAVATISIAGSVAYVLTRETGPRGQTQSAEQILAEETKAVETIQEAQGNVSALSASHAFPAVADGGHVGLGNFSFAPPPNWTYAKLEGSTDAGVRATNHSWHGTSDTEGKAVLIAELIAIPDHRINELSIANQYLRTATAGGNLTNLQSQPGKFIKLDGMEAYQVKFKAKNVLGGDVYSCVVVAVYNSQAIALMGVSGSSEGQPFYNLIDAATMSVLRAASAAPGAAATPGAATTSDATAAPSAQATPK